MAVENSKGLRLPAITEAYIKDLLQTGRYGKNRSEVIRRFVDRGITEAIHGDDIKRRYVKDFKK